MNLTNHININDLIDHLKDAFMNNDYHRVIHFYLEELQKTINVIRIDFISTQSAKIYSTAHDVLDDTLIQSLIEAKDNSQEVLEQLMNEFPYYFILPCYDHNQFNGYSVFQKDVCDIWNNREKENILIIDAFLNYIYLQKKGRDYKDEQTFIDLLNSINANIYVTDPITDEMLFVNDKIIESFHLQDVIGKKCWQVFKKDSHERCQICPISVLEKQHKKTYLWEAYSSYDNHTYQNYDCLMNWWDGRLVHIQHSVDITEFRQMKKDATYDELTGIYNRRAGKSMLSKQIIKAKKENKNIIVCLYDLDHLKETNDVFGHHIGDYMLKTIAHCVRDSLHENDVFLRLSGDEFIVSFYDYSMSDASTYMLDILKQLQSIKEKEKLAYQLSFCFGLYQVLPDNHLSISEIIMNADEKMYSWKKRSHLSKAIKASQLQSNPIHEFDYNEKLLYDALVKSTDDYIFICNMKTNIFKYTPAMVEEFEFPGEVLNNAAIVFGSKIHPDDKYEFLSNNQQITDGRTDSHIVEYRALNRHNEWVWLRCRGHVEYDESGEPSLFAGFISNLGKKNYRDILTGLYNKFEFEKQINETKGSFAVMMLNINDFKSINNLYDRTFGDNILRITAQNLQTLFHKETTVFKLDGDQFGMIFKNVSKEYVFDLFNQIQEYAFHEHTYENNIYSCSFTGGVVFAPKDGTSFLELSKNCEMALQYGKRYARNKLTLFDNSIFKQQTQTIQLMNALRQDMAHHFQNFSLMYQPKVKTDNQEIVGFEALCRWSRDGFMDIGPGTFIPLLEASHDIIVLGSWVFEQSLIQLKQWLKYKPDIMMSINVSYMQLIEEHFVEFVKTSIEKYQVPYSSIIIELTETALAKNSQSVIDIIQQLRLLGIQIAMDDFGKGYSSLSLLKDEPLDIIKIDQSFVRDIQNNTFNFTFMKFIIELSHQMQLKVVVEGVETKEEMTTVSHFHPDYIQGYYTGKPMFSEKATLFIQQSIDNS